MEGVRMFSSSPRRSSRRSRVCRMRSSLVVGREWPATAKRVAPLSRLHRLNPRPLQPTTRNDNESDTHTTNTM